MYIAAIGTRSPDFKNSFKMQIINQGVYRMIKIQLMGPGCLLTWINCGNHQVSQNRKWNIFQSLKIKAKTH